MDVSADQIAQFTAILTSELESARQLNKILDREHQALTSGDPEQILVAADDKQHQMQETLKRLTERNRFLQTLNLPPGNKGAEQFVGFIPNDAPAHDLWGEIEELAKTLRDKNEVNGGIVSLAQRHTRQALDILSGKIYSGDTYGRGGERQSGPSAPPIAKA
ncbi:MAG: flagellar protein FlgN [Chromatiales bacterium]|nr:flagellar protein FlgN [Chromatiales bacterium]